MRRRKAVMVHANGDGMHELNTHLECSGTVEGTTQIHMGSAIVYLITYDTDEYDRKYKEEDK